jgi:hypothetical protein
MKRERSLDGNVKFIVEHALAFISLYRPAHQKGAWSEKRILSNPAMISIWSIFCQRFHIQAAKFTFEPSLDRNETAFSYRKLDVVQTHKTVSRGDIKGVEHRFI